MQYTTRARFLDGGKVITEYVDVSINENVPWYGYVHTATASLMRPGNYQIELIDGRKANMVIAHLGVGDGPGIRFEGSGPPPA